MDFTFGIITDGSNDNFVREVVGSIRNQNIPNHEVIVVGGGDVYGGGAVHIPFDETIKDGWITRKKNIITRESKYENIVYMHDYIALCDGWYDGYVKYGNGFSACMNIIYNKDGSRFRDWILGYPSFVKNNEFLLDYGITHLSKMMYFSGSYWVAKKWVMEEIPLDENRSWGQAEDAVWSNKYREKYAFSMNVNSSVRLLKYKQNTFNQQSEDTINFLRSVDDQYIKNNYRG